MDNVSKEKRSWIMSRIKGKNTKPEMVVRHMLHKMGYRFRLHGKVSKKICRNGILPGKPDIVLAKYKTVIFVHGCFWHMHKNCNSWRMPKSNIKYWEEKLRYNVIRDAENKEKIEKVGFRVVIIWGCETRDLDELKKIISKRIAFVN